MQKQITSIKDAITELMSCTYLYENNDGTVVSCDEAVVSRDVFEQMMREDRLVPVGRDQTKRVYKLAPIGIKNTPHLHVDDGAGHCQHCHCAM